MREIVIRPIGRVRNSIGFLKREGWESVRSEIIIRPQYEEALDGIEEYSHLLVLFWVTRIPKNRKGLKKVHPRSREDLPLVGVLATRTQYRPNPVGLTLVELLSRKKNILRVRGLDAIKGTPVIDIKPISPRTDFPAKARVPQWYRRLWKKDAGGSTKGPKSR